MTKRQVIYTGVFIGPAIHYVAFSVFHPECFKSIARNQALSFSLFKSNLLLDLYLILDMSEHKNLIVAMLIDEEAMVALKGIK